MHRNRKLNLTLKMCVCVCVCMCVCVFGLPKWPSGKESANQCRRCEFDLALRRALGGGNDNPLLYSCLEDPLERGAWQTAVHGAAKDMDTNAATKHITSRVCTHTHTHTHTSNLCMHAKSLQLCLTLCDLMDFSPPGSLSMGFSRQEYWSGLPFPPPGDLPNAGIEPTSLMSSALAGRFFITSATWEAQL